MLKVFQGLLQKVSEGTVRSPGPSQWFDDIHLVSTLNNAVFDSTTCASSLARLLKGCIATWLSQCPTVEKTESNWLQIAEGCRSVTRQHKAIFAQTYSMQQFTTNYISCSNILSWSLQSSKNWSTPCDAWSCIQLHSLAWLAKRSMFWQSSNQLH